MTCNQYWGNGGQTQTVGIEINQDIDSELDDREKIVFSFKKTSPGNVIDHGDNGHNWGHFPILVYKIVE